MKNINIKAWLILVAFIVFSVSMQAQFRYYDGNAGDYEIGNHTVILDYEPLSPNVEWFQGKGAKQWLAELAALNITNDKTEMDINKSSTSALKVHLYYPVRDTDGNYTTDDTKLPVIVWGYGGGFLKHWSTTRIKQGYDDVIPRWLAKHGYLVICPEYRIGINLHNKELSERAIWRAVQDLRITIRYARQVDDAYTNADTNAPLTYLGWSSGAFMGLHNLYLDDGGNRPASTKNLLVNYNTKVHWYDRNHHKFDLVYNLGTLDNPRIGKGESDYFDGAGLYNGDPVQDITVAISGALGKLEWISTTTNPKPKALYLMQHREDGVVPHEEGHPYENFGLFANPKFDYPTVYGTHAINAAIKSDTINLKPAIYKHVWISSDCAGLSDKGDDSCVDGDAGGATGALGYQRWYHDPMQSAANLDVMNSILDFIRTSTTTLTTGVANRSLTTVNEPVLIEESVDIEEALIVYPNPAKGKFSIKIGDYEEAYKLEGYDFTGNLLVTEKIKNPTTDVYTVDSSKLIPGLYVFKLYTNSGIKTAKVMIE